MSDKPIRKAMVTKLSKNDARKITENIIRLHEQWCKTGIALGKALSNARAEGVHVIENSNQSWTNYVVNTLQIDKSYASRLTKIYDAYCLNWGISEDKLATISHQNLNMGRPFLLSRESVEEVVQDARELTYEGFRRRYYPDADSQEASVIDEPVPPPKPIQNKAAEISELVLTWGDRDIQQLMVMLARRAGSAILTPKVLGECINDYSAQDLANLFSEIVEHPAFAEVDGTRLGELLFGHCDDDKIILLGNMLETVLSRLMWEASSDGISAAPSLA